MSGGAPVLRRLVLDLTHGNGASLRAAAEFAAQLGVALHGVFVEDEAVFHLAGMPFARELRLPTHDWRTMDADRIARDFQAAAAQARRMLDQTVRGLGVPGGFEVLRGDPATCLATLPDAADIMVLPARQPPGPSFAGAAGVLVLPDPARAPSGAVAVVPDGPALQLATRCAMASSARLLILAPSEETLRESAAFAAARGLPADRIILRLLGGTEFGALLHALGDAPQRLLVLPRGMADPRDETRTGAASRWRRMPVLLVGTGQRSDQT